MEVLGGIPIRPISSLHPGHLIKCKTLTRQGLWGGGYLTLTNHIMAVIGDVNHWLAGL